MIEIDNKYGLEKMSEWGWTNKRQADFDRLSLSNCLPGRILTEHKGLYRAVTANGDLLVEVSGKLRHESTGRGDYPAAGDWVAVQPQEGEARGVIHAVMPRTSKFSRKLAGAIVDEQIVAANVDTVLLVCALNHDYNVRRLERYLILAWESGAKPVIVLTKADLSDRSAEQVLEVENIAPGVPVILTSVIDGSGLEVLRELAQSGETLALLGSSGAGKSSLVNALLEQDIQAVQDIRAGDDRGRHTTTHRELFLLPGGGIVIDTPGMRELQLWHADGGFDEAFADIEALAARCRFNDCRHHGERDCAVTAAMDVGELDPARFNNYLKLQKELAYLARKDSTHHRQQEKASGRRHAKFLKEIYRGRD